MPCFPKTKVTFRLVIKNQVSVKSELFVGFKLVGQKINWLALGLRVTQCSRFKNSAILEEI